METSKKFNKRAFYSVGMLISGISLPLSGVMNHFLGFEGLTVSRHFWMCVHFVCGGFFTIFALLHIKLNWRSIKNYVNNYKRIIISKEALAAIAIVGFCVVLISTHAFHAG